MLALHVVRLFLARAAEISCWLLALAYHSEPGKLFISVAYSFSYFRRVCIEEVLVAVFI